MLYPSIDSLMEKADSKYIVVVAAAKRARQLQEGSEPKVNGVYTNKNVTVALNEIFQDKVRYTRIHK
jgi:DNA-directed RNA polymerase subunit omega